MHVHVSVLGAVQLRKFQQTKMYVHVCVCVGDSSIEKI